MIEELILKGRREQVFLSFFLPQLVFGMIPNIHPNMGQIKFILISLTYLIWIFMLGKALNRCIPKRYRLNDTFQVIFLFVFVIIYVPIVMFFDVGVRFYGWAVWIPLIMLFSLIYLFYFASKALKSAEQLNRASFSEHFGEMLLLLFAWIGIWFIQPRINKLYRENKAIFDEDI